MKVDIPLAPHPEFFGCCRIAKRPRPTQGAKPIHRAGGVQPFIARAEADFEKTLKDRTDAGAKS